MLVEKDINILEEGLIYINSKGRRVKKFPRTCLGGFYTLDAAYKETTYATFQYIAPENIRDKLKIKEARQILLVKVLKELTA